MKLLIITQAVDREHPILGFFHRWIEEFAARCEKVAVIGQQSGDHALPANVTVLSLGKERGDALWKQVARFWYACLSQEYDAVFVHMTPVWVVLGAPLWFVRRKRTYLWYEVRRGGWMLRAATVFVETVFSATVHGLPWTSPKQAVVGHGIDTEFFHPPSLPRDPYELLAVGRITRVKRVETIIGCLARIPASFRLRLIGPVVTEDDRAYKAELDALIARLHLGGRVRFETTDQRGIAEALRRARIVLHAAAGGLDKALLEAMSCACPTLSCSEAACDILPDACRTTPVNMASDTATALIDGRLEAAAVGLRRTVERDHALPRLIDRLVADMSA